MMSLTIPDDFMFTPRGFGYLIDQKLLGRLTKICRKYYGHSFLDDPEIVVMGCRAIEARLKLGLSLDCRAAVRQLPITGKNGELIIVLFYAQRWRELHVRPGQWKIDEINEALEREPEWFILYHW